MLIKWLKQCTRFERIWFSLFTVIIIAVSVYFSLSGTKWGDARSVILNWIISPVSALAGIITVILCAKGNINNYLFGIVNAAAYGAIAWVSGYYGDWILNWFFFVPTQVLIFFGWRKHMRQDDPSVVKMKRLSAVQFAMLGGIGLIALIIFGFVLSAVDHWFVNYMKRSATIYGNITKAFGIALLGPLFDSATEVFQIFAQILCIRRQAEQWLFWIATNVITVIMWIAVVVTDHASLPWALPTLVMWVAFFMNSIYGASVWYKNAERI